MSLTKKQLAAEADRLARLNKLYERQNDRLFSDRRGRDETIEKLRTQVSDLKKRIRLAVEALDEGPNFQSFPWRSQNALNALLRRRLPKTKRETR